MTQSWRAVTAYVFAVASPNSVSAGNANTSYVVSTKADSLGNDLLLNNGSSGILIGVVAVYKTSVIDMVDDYRKTCLALNGAHAAEHDHTLVLRQTATLVPVLGMHVAWEKIVLLIDYLELDYRYAMTIDIDAAISKHDVDVASSLAHELEVSGKDILFTDCQGIHVSGWECMSHGCINTGVMMARNTHWARTFLRELLADTAPSGICSEYARAWGWENQCLSKKCKRNPSLFGGHVLILNGDRYNRASGSIASYLYNCSLYPFTIWNGFSRGKCKYFHDRYVRDYRMYILHLVPGKLGSYTTLFDLYNMLIRRYGPLGQKWIGHNISPIGEKWIVRDRNRERAQTHMIAYQEWEENPLGVQDDDR